MGPFMSRIRDLKIRAKLTLISAASAAIALACVLVAFVVQDLDLVKQVKQEQVESQLAVLGANLAHALAEGDPATAQHLLESVASDHGIVEAQVFDPRGEPLMRYARAPEDADEFDAVGLHFSSRSFSRPLVWQGRPVGSLNVLVSYADVEMRVVYLLFYSLLAFAFAVTIAVLSARLVQKIVSQPLLKLHRLTQNVRATGNYGLRARVQGRDEIGQLGQAINEMLTQIEQRDVMLEKQVAQRTLELKRLAEEFRYRALHDTLTGLPNRALLTEEFHRAVAHAARVNKHFALLLLDLDNFKTINDTLGHEAGDEVLKAVAQRIRAALRAEDIICRLGGDEFVVLIEDLDNDSQIHTVGRSLLSALAEPLWTQGKPFALGLSIGVSIYPQHGASLDELKDNADSAMYSAKHAGKNRCVIYEVAARAPQSSRTVLLDELKQALAAGQFEIHYQPIINVQQQSLVGCEALVRWQHRELGLLQPADFIPLAERCGLMVELDQYVLMQACRDCQTWSRQLGKPLPVSVNLSAVQYQSSTLVVSVKKALGESGLRPRDLTLELPEASLSLVHSLRKALNQVRGLGVKLALDNFGLGDAPLFHLQDLPVDALKLDASYAAALGRGRADLRLTKGIVAMARALEVELIVEGVEMAEQEAVLRGLGCTVMQGFLFAPPLPGSRLLSWFEQFNTGREAELMTV